jgi:hypothetical protein
MEQATGRMAVAQYHTRDAMGFTCNVLAHIFSNPERLTGRLKPLERGNGKLSQCSCDFKADCLI